MDKVPVDYIVKTKFNSYINIIYRFTYRFIKIKFKAMTTFIKIYNTVVVF